jgi:amidase
VTSSPTHTAVAGDVGAALSSAVDAVASAVVKGVERWREGIDPSAVFESFNFHFGWFFAYQQAEEPPETYRRRW